MRVFSAALAAMSLVAALPEAAKSQSASSPATAKLEASAKNVTSSPWGPLLALGGREWRSGFISMRFKWIEPGRVLAWQTKAAFGGWVDMLVLSIEGKSIEAASAPIEIRTKPAGTMKLGPAGEAIITMSTGNIRTFVAEGDTLVLRASGPSQISQNFTLTQVESNWTQTAAIAAAEAEVAKFGPATPPRVSKPQSGPIIVAAAPSASSGVKQAPTPAAPPTQNPTRASSTGPIVVATTLPPAAAIREAPVSATKGNVPRPAGSSSREALMQAQVAARREQASREAEAERQRRAQIAEAARIAEANRQAQAAADAASRNEMLGLFGAVLGGVVVGSQTGGDMSSINAGMALGSAFVAPESEVATAASGIMAEDERRAEEQRAFEARVIAELHNPNNPLTQAAQQRDAKRAAATAAEQKRIDTEYTMRREAADREALFEKQMAQAQSDRSRQQQEDSAAQAARQEQQRRATAQREREVAQAQAEKAAREEAERQRRELAAREAEKRRQEQERQRQAAEAERTRIIDYKEAVVLCELTGGQAQFKNWRCEGPLQMNYVNFENANWVSQLAMTDCSNPRELPRAGAYRVFGCGFGVHPTSPGALRNVPEMLGVFVDGRRTYRCPRNGPVTCRNQ